jgi:hypothetical protein
MTEGVDILTRPILCMSNSNLVLDGACAFIIKHSPIYPSCGGALLTSCDPLCTQLPHIPFCSASILGLFLFRATIIHHPDL